MLEGGTQTVRGHDYLAGGLQFCNDLSESLVIDSQLSAQLSPADWAVCCLKGIDHSRPEVDLDCPGGLRPIMDDEMRLVIGIIKTQG